MLLRNNCILLYLKLSQNKVQYFHPTFYGVITVFLVTFFLLLTMPIITAPYYRDQVMNKIKLTVHSQETPSVINSSSKNILKVATWFGKWCRLELITTANFSPTDQSAM